MRAEPLVLAGSSASAWKFYIISSPKNPKTVYGEQSYNIKSPILFVGRKFSKSKGKHKVFTKATLQILSIPFVVALNFRKFSPRRRISETLCCNFASNKPFRDFLDSKLCRIFTRRRSNRSEVMNQSLERIKRKMSFRSPQEISNYKYPSIASPFLWTPPRTVCRRGLVPVFCTVMSKKYM